MAAAVSPARGAWTTANSTSASTPAAAGGRVRTTVRDHTARASRRRHVDRLARRSSWSCGSATTVTPSPTASTACRRRQPGRLIVAVPGRRPRPDRPFEADALLVSVDTTTCTPAPTVSTTTCRSADPWPAPRAGGAKARCRHHFDGTPTTVVQYTDKTNRSLLRHADAGPGVCTACIDGRDGSVRAAPDDPAPTATSPPPTMTTVADPVTAADVSGHRLGEHGRSGAKPPRTLGPVPDQWFMPLPDGSIRGADGCRMFASDPGSWRIDAGTLTTGPIPFSENTCSGHIHLSPFDDGPITLEPMSTGVSPSRQRTNHPLRAPRRDNRVSTSAVVGRSTDGGPNTYEFRSDGSCDSPPPRRATAATPFRRPPRRQLRRVHGELRRSCRIPSSARHRPLVAMDGSAAHQWRRQRVRPRASAMSLSASASMRRTAPASEVGLSLLMALTGDALARSAARALTSLTAMLSSVAGTRGTWATERLSVRPRAMRRPHQCSGPVRYEGSQHCLLSVRYRRLEAVGGVRGWCGGLGR